MSPLVSVIIPNYNHEKYLGKRIDSVINQTFKDYEIILLDDASTDDSAKILDLYSKESRVSHLIRNTGNSGSPISQWLKGINLARGEYIWIAESDDYSDTDFLQSMVELLEQGNSIAYCRSVTVDENEKICDEFFWPDGLDGKKWKKSHCSHGYDEIRSSFAYRNCIPNASSCVFRKESISFCGCEKMLFAGDWMFWLNILTTGFVAYSCRKLNYFRRHSNTTRQLRSKELEKQRLLEYVTAVTHARRLSGLSSYRKDWHKYAWIFEQINERKKILGGLLKTIRLLPAGLKYYYVVWQCQHSNRIFKNVVHVLRGNYYAL